MNVVRIKKWEQLVSEFGITDTNDIACRPPFTAEMEKHISKEPGRIIVAEPQRKGASIYEYPLVYKPDDNTTWAITRDMVVGDKSMLGLIIDDMRKKIETQEDQ